MLSGELNKGAALVCCAYRRTLEVQFQVNPLGAPTAANEDVATIGELQGIHYQASDQKREQGGVTGHKHGARQSAAQAHALGVGDRA